MINIGIVGYGNLGKGVETALQHLPDIQCLALFTRRDPKQLQSTTTLHCESVMDAIKYQQSIDVMIMCGGSAHDLKEQSPAFAKNFCIVDSFDTHALIPQHFANVHQSTKKNQTTALISAGWDPGLFSIQRVMNEAILPQGQSHTFWGKGVSQGHSEAIKNIEGVIEAKQYTIPLKSAMKAARASLSPVLTTRQKHRRVCYVVAKKTANKSAIKNQIITMKDYFANYQTTVHFISMETFQKDHQSFAHGGSVIHNAPSDPLEPHLQSIEYQVRLSSNPSFTGHVMCAYARAIYRLHQEGIIGCKTVFDIPPSYLHPLPQSDLLSYLL